MNQDHLKKHVSQIAYAWLSSQSSLTKRLRELTHNQISHHLFYDDWGAASGIAYSALNIQPSSHTWIRKMEWRLDQEKWVAGTVVIPETSITPQTEILTRIGKNSIGDILFQDSSLQRSEFDFLQDQDEENNSVWTRYSIFYYYQQPLLILESFFPEFFHAIEQ